MAVEFKNKRAPKLQPDSNAELILHTLDYLGDRYDCTACLDDGILYLDDENDSWAPCVCRAGQALIGKVFLCCICGEPAVYCLKSDRPLCKEHGKRQHVFNAVRPKAPVIPFPGVDR